MDRQELQALMKTMRQVSLNDEAPALSINHLKFTRQILKRNKKRWNRNPPIIFHRSSEKPLIVETEVVPNPFDEQLIAVNNLIKRKQEFFHKLACLYPGFRWSMIAR